MTILYSAPTPNGFKVSIMLEELGVPYEVKNIDLGAGDQRQGWFLAINPNGRIPALKDGDQHIFESGAILINLAEKHGRFLPKEEPQRSQVMQWLMFQMGGVGPMQGQAGVFVKYAPEKIPYAIERYTKETRRLYEVLNGQLQKCEYISGDYSIADMALYPWITFHDWVGVDIDDLEHLSRWFTLMGSRPAVKKGMNIPERRRSDSEIVSTAKSILV